MTPSPILVVSLALAESPPHLSRSILGSNVMAHVWACGPAHLSGEPMDMDEAQDVLRLLLKGSAAFDPEAEGLYGHLLMDEATRREKLFYFLPEVGQRSNEHSLSRSIPARSDFSIRHRFDVVLIDIASISTNFSLFFIVVAKSRISMVILILNRRQVFDFGDISSSIRHPISTIVASTDHFLAGSSALSMPLGRCRSLADRTSPG